MHNLKEDTRRRRRIKYAYISLHLDAAWMAQSTGNILNIRSISILFDCKNKYFYFYDTVVVARAESM